MDEKRKQIDEESKFRVRQAYDMMVQSGDEWIKKNGEQKFNDRVDYVRVHIRTWNQLTKSTIPYSLQTIDAMMLMISTMPSMIGMDILTRSEYRELMAAFSAMRNRLMKERDEKIKLSTPKLDNDIK